GWSNKVTEYLPPEVSLPAIGQGALGLEGRRHDRFVQTLVEKLEHRPTRTAVMAERALLKRLEGGCQVPIAAHATVKGDTLIMDGLIASVDGQRLIRDTIQGPASEAQSLGSQLAEKLLAQGGDRILNEIYGNT
ncbi:MAG: hydroxymethylbilane synthase, partial [Nitrospirae bacterium]